MGSALAILLIVVGAVPALLVIRVQLFSLAALPGARGACSAPRRVAVTPGLARSAVLGLWSNLHGAVLVGLAVAVSYLVLDASASHGRSKPPRFSRPRLIAVCATPALERTPDYYLGVLRNEAARRGEGLWAALSLASAFDLLLLAAAVLLRRSCTPVATARSGSASRSPLWRPDASGPPAQASGCSFFAAPPAARRVPFRRGSPSPVAARRAIRGRVPSTVSSADRIPQAQAEPDRGRPCGRPAARPSLAEDPSRGAGRARGWPRLDGNPLDAFSRRDQRLYLDWLEGAPGTRPFAHAPRIVLVRPAAAPPDRAALGRRATLIAADDGAPSSTSGIRRDQAHCGDCPLRRRHSDPPVDGATRIWWPFGLRATTRPRTLSFAGATTYSALTAPTSRDIGRPIDARTSAPRSQGRRRVLHR